MKNENRKKGLVKDICDVEVMLRKSIKSTNLLHDKEINSILFTIVLSNNFQFYQSYIYNNLSRSDVSASLATTGYFIL